MASLPNMSPKRQVLNKKLKQSVSGRMPTGHRGGSHPGNPFSTLQNFLQQNYNSANQGGGLPGPGSATGVGAIASDQQMSQQGQNNPYASLGNPSYNNINLQSANNALPGQPGYFPSSFTQTPYSKYPGLAANINPSSNINTLSLNSNY